MADNNKIVGLLFEDAAPTWHLISACERQNFSRRIVEASVSKSNRSPTSCCAALIPIFQGCLDLLEEVQVNWEIDEGLLTDKTSFTGLDLHVICSVVAFSTSA